MLLVHRSGVRPKKSELDAVGLSMIRASNARTLRCEETVMEERTAIVAELLCRASPSEVKGEQRRRLD